MMRLESSPKRKFKVALVNPNTREIGRVATTNPPLGLLCLASYLRTHGIAVKFIDADIDNYTHQDVAVQVEDCDVVGVTMTTMQASSGYNLITYLKHQFPEKTYLVGGSHPSGMQQRIFRDCPAIDCVVIGEGEETTLELCENLKKGRSIDSVQGICTVTVKPTRRRRIIDLDQLPFPAVDLAMPLTRYNPYYPPNKGQLAFPIMAMRGCPYHCRFCGSGVVWQHQVVKNSPEYIVSEIEHLRTFGVDEIFFLDDTLNLNRKWLTDLCDQLIEVGLHREMWFKGQIRANTHLCDRELFELMKEAGFWLLALGAESGCQTILDAWNKQLTVQDVERCFRLLKQVGLKTCASFIIGHPQDTEETVMQTIRWAKKLSPDHYDFPLASPLPHTDFEREAAEKGLIVDSDWSHYYMGQAVVKTETLSTEELNFLRRKAFHDVKPLIARLKIRWNNLWK